MISPVISVKDVDASIDFYTNKLGFKLDFVLEGPDNTNSFAFVSWGAAHFGLSKQQMTEPVGRGVIFNIDIPQDADLDAYYADVQKRGVTLDQPIKDQYWGDRNFTLVDLDGYHLTFSQQTKEVSMEEIAKVMKEKDAP